jgi:hypothetical protein
LCDVAVLNRCLLQRLEGASVRIESVSLVLCLTFVDSIQRTTLWVTSSLFILGSFDGTGF